MASRTRRRAVEQNLDSLLDTMANVTGILVVMLAVVQISTGDAVGRLRELLAQRPELTPASLSLATEQAEAIRAELESRSSASEELASRRSAAREQLGAVRAESARLEEAIAAAGSGDPQALRARLRTAAANEQTLRGSLAGARAERSALEQQVTALGSQPARRSMRLPDPRPAPAGARGLPVLVRYGRALVVDDRALIEELYGGVERALHAPLDRTSLSVLPQHQRVRLRSYFDQLPVGVGGLRWRITGDGATLAAVLEWRREDLGEATGELALPTSDFQRELRRTSPSRVFLRYIVWADGFEAYLAARRASDAAGFAAGFEAQENDENILQPLARPAVQRLFVD